MTYGGRRVGTSIWKCPISTFTGFPSSTPSSLSSSLPVSFTPVLPISCACLNDAAIYGRVLTTLENVEISGNLLILENSEKRLRI